MAVRRLLEIKEHSGAIYSCSYHNGYIYSASADKYVTRWNPESGTQDKLAIKFENAVYAIDLYENRLFAGLSNGDVHFIDIEAREEVRFFQQHKAAIFAIKVNPVKKHLYVGDADGYLSIWDISKESLLMTMPFACGKIRDITISNDGGQIVLACQDGHMRVLETNHFNELADVSVNNDGVNAVLFQPRESDQILTGGKDAHLDLWALPGRQLKHIPAHNFAIYRIIELDDCLATASRDGSIKLWQKNDLSFIEKIDRASHGHTHSVNDLASVSGNKFVSCGDDHRLILWQIT